MISANLCFSCNSNSDAACNRSERAVNLVRRYFLNAFSARLNRFSISASLNEENSFSFWPVAGLIDAIGISLSYIAIAILEERTPCEPGVAELRPPHRPPTIVADLLE